MSNISVSVTPGKPVMVTPTVGEPGPAGPPGPSGLTWIVARWSYVLQTAPPPAAGQMRTDPAVMKAYLSDTGSDGFNRERAIQQLSVGSEVEIKTNLGDVVVLNVTSAPVDMGGWWEWGYAVVSGDVNTQKNQEVELLFLIGSA